MKIGILQPAGLAAEIVSKSFSIQETQELYKPVIYSKENKNDKNVLPDLREGKIDAIAVAPGSKFAIPSSVSLSVTDQVSVATAIPADDIQTVYQTISLELIKEKLKILITSLRRDFCNTNPRVALLALNTSPDSQEKNILEPAVKASIDEGLSVHGPYLFDAFINEQKYAHFDAVLAITSQQTATLLKLASDDVPTNIILGMPYIITVCTGKLPEKPVDADNPAGLQQQYKGEEQPTENSFLAPYIAQMRKAYYLAIDCTRNRKIYDKAAASPLPKLYHERREDGEKARFSIKRPPFMKSKEENPEGPETQTETVSEN